MHFTVDADYEVLQVETNSLCLSSAINTVASLLAVGLSPNCMYFVLTYLNQQHTRFRRSSSQISWRYTFCCKFDSLHREINRIEEQAT